MNATATDSNLVSYARSELERAGLFDSDSDYGGMLGESILTVVETFASAGHSGMSASMAVDILDRLLRYEPLTPLTYAEDEWNKVSDEPLWQNRRKSDVFSKDHGATWYCLDGTTGVRS